MILAKAALEFRKKHGGALPSDKQGRTELKEIIRSWIRTVDNCPIPEENFEEALANVNKIWAPPKIRTCSGHFVHGQACSGPIVTSLDLTSYASVH